MALRKTAEDEKRISLEREKKIQETLKSNRFKCMIIEIQKYLVWRAYPRFLYEAYGSSPFYYLPGNMILLVGNRDATYIDIFLKEVGKTINHDYEGRNDISYSYKTVKESNWWSVFCDEDNDKNEKLEIIVRKLNNDEEIQISDDYVNVFVFPNMMKHYIIFWNLFLAAMDDDIYNEQLATVAELAACFGFDEPMMRDWCRAVEYVFAGNKLSEDCDLECETVEGARFFLHKEE